jgi:hypothetical protein
LGHFGRVSHTKAVSSELIKGCDDPISRGTTHVDTLFCSRLKSRLSTGDFTYEELFELSIHLRSRIADSFAFHG